jgi:hypothetical protein
LSGPEPIHDTDWQRFNEYARRVRALDISPLHNEKIDISLYLQVALLGKNPLLPSLRDLQCSQPHPSVTKLLPYLAPTLRRVYLCLTSADINDQSLLRALGENATSLQSLVLDGTFSLGCLQVMPLYRSLRILDIGSLPIDQHSFDVLSCLPHLSDLRININATGIQYPPHSTIRPFAVLEALEITDCSSISSITGLVAFISSTRLQGIVWFRPYTCELNAWHNFIEALVSTPRYKLSLRTIIATLEFLPRQVSVMPSIEPLRGLTGLEMIRLSLSGVASRGQNLGDGDVALLVSSWPNILTLELNASSKLTPQATFKSLHMIAHRCPQLVELRLAFDFTNLPPAHSVPILSHGLKEIGLSTSTIGDSDEKQLVRLLDRLFPHLRPSQMSANRMF